MKLLPQDHALLVSCAAAMTRIEIPLTQNLLQMQDIVSMHCETMTGCHGEGREGVHAYKGGVNGVVDGLGREEEKLRAAGVYGESGDIKFEVGEKVVEEVREEVVGEVDKEVVGEMDEEVVGEVREAVVGEGNGEVVGEVEREEAGNVEEGSEEELKVRSVIADLEEEHLHSDVTGLLQGGIQDGSDFPSGPIFSDSQISGEPDLDSTLSQAEEVELDSAFSRAEDDCTPSKPLEVEGSDAESAEVIAEGEEVPWGNNLAGGNDVMGVARSQSKAIPQAVVGYMPNSLELSNSTPNSLKGSSSVGGTPSDSVGRLSSLGGSVGGTPSMDSSMGNTPSFGGTVSLGGSRHCVSLDPSVSSVESQGALDYQDKETAASRTRQMSLHVASSKEEEDVIAVPVILRSSSTG